MKVLAIDTSNLVMSVAVADGGVIVGEFTTYLKKNHSVRLMPAISELMKEVGIAPAELEKIVVARGPGSYTGVRIGVTTAKSLAWSLQIPIVGVSSLEVLAQNGRHFPGFICPLFDARRGQVYTGLYQWHPSGLEEKISDQLLLLDDWLPMLQSYEEDILFLGNDLSIHVERIKEALGSRAFFGQVSQQNPRASELIALAQDRPISTNVHEFVPTYLQLAEAEVKWLAAQKKEG